MSPISIPSYPPTPSVPLRQTEDNSLSPPSPFTPSPLQLPPLPLFPTLSSPPQFLLHLLLLLLPLPLYFPPPLPFPPSLPFSLSPRSPIFRQSCFSIPLLKGVLRISLFPLSTQFLSKVNMSSYYCHSNPFSKLASFPPKLLKNSNITCQIT